MKPKKVARNAEEAFRTFRQGDLRATGEARCRQQRLRPFASNDQLQGKRKKQAEAEVLATARSGVTSKVKARPAGLVIPKTTAQPTAPSKSNRTKEVRPNRCGDC